MRILICLLLFCNLSVSAQSIYFLRDSAVIKEIPLPAKQPFDTARTWQKITGPYIYIISDKDCYDLFGYDRSMQFYQFDFLNYHILGELKCEQCIMVCKHDEGVTNCHRNRCDEKWVWVIRENKKAFTDIPLAAKRGQNRKDIPMYNDTIIGHNADSATWYTTGQGDCFAHFTYSIIQDRYRPVLILKEKNYWGGCRAGGSQDHMLLFKKPEEITYTIKRTILMPKRNEGEFEEQ